MRTFLSLQHEPPHPIALQTVNRVYSTNPLQCQARAAHADNAFTRTRQSLKYCTGFLSQRWIMYRLAHTDPTCGIPLVDFNLMGIAPYALDSCEEDREQPQENVPGKTRSLKTSLPSAPLTAWTIVTVFDGVATSQ